MSKTQGMIPTTANEENVRLRALELCKGKKLLPPKQKWNHKTVPALIQYTIGTQSLRGSRWDLMQQYCSVQQLLLLERPYRKLLTDADAVALVRKHRGLASDVPVTILFNDHPRGFLEVAFDKYRTSYSELKGARRRNALEKIDKVLSLIGQWDPRKGETDAEYRDRRGYSY